MTGRSLLMSALLLASLPAAPARGQDGVPADAVGSVMAAEFALQSGDAATAAGRYLEASLLVADPAIAERAVRVALLADARDAARAGLRRWQQLAPGSAELMSQAVALALRDGEHETAMEQAQALLALPGESGWPLLLRALADARGDAEVIARSVVVALTDQAALPPTSRAWLAFAGLARRLGDVRTSGRLIDGAVARFPDDPSIRLLGAARLRERGDSAGARVALAALLDGTPELPASLRRNAAKELAAAGDPVAAARLLGQGGGDPASYPLRIGWLVAAGARGELAAIYTELVGKSDVALPQRALLLGHVAEALQRWPEAETWYGQAAAIAGGEVAALRLAQVLDHQQRSDEAVAALRRLQADEAADGERVREAYLAEGELHSRRGRDAEALAAYQRGLAVYEGDPVLTYARALHHERQDRVDAALADLRRILDQDPDNTDALNAYGYTLADRRQRYAEALTYIEKAHRQQPDSAAVLDSLGWVKHRLGQRQEALALLERAWKLQQDPEIAAHFGEALWLDGRRDEARAVWRVGQDLDPDNRALRKAMELAQP